MKKIVTNTGLYGPFNRVGITDAAYICDGAILPFNVVGIGTVSDWTGDLPVQAPIDTPLQVPQTLTMMQARIVLLQAGLLDEINAAVLASNDIAKIAWEYSSVVNRDNPIVNAVALAAGLSQAQLDQLFIDGAKIL